jgi:hypothetical protein
LRSLVAWEKPVRPGADLNAAAGAAGGRPEELAHRHLHQPLTRTNLLQKRFVSLGGLDIVHSC